MDLFGRTGEKSSKIYSIKAQVQSDIFIHSMFTIFRLTSERNSTVIPLVFHLTADISKIYKFCPYKMYRGKERINGVFPFLYHRTEKLLQDWRNCFRDWKNYIVGLEKLFGIYSILADPV